MNATEKNKLKHDFLNAIVIINSMTKSASSFLDKITEKIDSSEVEKKQLERFFSSMNAVREQTAKIEKYFEKLLKS